MSDTKNPITHQQNGEPRHPSIVGVLSHFKVDGLPDNKQVIADFVLGCAIANADACNQGADLVCGLRELLAARDNFLRAAKS